MHSDISVILASKTHSFKEQVDKETDLIGEQSHADLSLIHI